MTPAAKPRRFDLEQARQIAKEYAEPHSMIDSGNLFFALDEFMEAYDAIVKERDELKEECERKETFARESESKRFDLDLELQRERRKVEKLSLMVTHYETCSTVDRYDDEEVECDCGLLKELQAIDEGRE